MTAILDATEGDTLRAEDAEKYDRIEGEVNSLADEIGRLERAAGIESTLTRDAALADREAEHAARAEAAEGENRFAQFLPNRADAPWETDDYRDAFEVFLRGGYAAQEVRAAMQVGTDSEGGYWVPEEWSNKLIEAMTQYGGVEPNAFILQTSTGVPLHIPKVVDASPADSTGQNPDLIAEEGAYTESEDTVDEAILNAYKYGHIVKASDELVQDSMFDIDGFIRRRAARALALRTGERFVKGDGTDKPKGIAVAATSGKTLTATNAVTSDELIDVQHSVPVPYRALAKWLLHDTTVKAVRKLKDSDGQYVWQPGLQAGQPDSLLGSPVVLDPFIDNIGSGVSKVVGVYGDLSSYWVRRAGGASIKVLDQLYAANGQIGYRVDIRVDGDLVDLSGVRSFKTAAA